MSTFEISATYVPAGQPDVLDLYKVENYNKGIILTNIGGQGRNSETQIEWSPVVRLIDSSYAIG